MGHEYMCIGRPTLEEKSRKEYVSSSVRMVQDFMKYSLGSNELFLVAAKLITGWISGAYTAAEPTSSRGFDDLIFQKELLFLVESFFMKFPADLEYLEFVDKKRSREIFESCHQQVHDEFKGDEAGPSLSDILREQCEESWLLFRALVLYGRCSHTIESLLCTIKCSVMGKSGKLAIMEVFSLNMWIVLITSIKYHLVPVTVPSTMAGPIKDVLQTTNTIERQTKADPYLRLFFPDHGFTNINQNHIERRIARLAQFSQPNGEDEHTLNMYNSHFLVLLPTLSRRVVWTDVDGNTLRPIQHSCLPNAAMEVHISAVDEGDMMAGDQSASDCVAFRSCLQIRLVAQRDVNITDSITLEGRCVTKDTEISVNRIQLHCTDDVTFDDYSVTLKSSYYNRQKALQNIFCSIGEYECPCFLCAYERDLFDNHGEQLNICYIHDTLKEYERNQAESDRLNNAWSEENVLWPPVLHELPIRFRGMSKATLFGLGEYYMQSNRFIDAVKVYYAIVLLNHQIFHYCNTNAVKFDATPYFHMGSALLDAGDSRNAFNAWALGYGMDPGNYLLLTQRQKDVSFLYVTSRSTTDGVSSSVSSDMIRNFKLFSRKDNTDISNFTKKLESLYKSASASFNTASDFKSFGFGIHSSCSDSTGLPWEDAESIISLCESYVNEELEIVAEDGQTCRRRRGWTTTRHYDAPTTDIPVHAVPGVLEIFNKFVIKKLGPMLHHIIGGSGQTYMYINDAFVVKYEVQPDESGAVSQRFLPVHTDQSHYSFTIALNSRSEYENGGTYFVDLDHSIQLDKGSCLIFPGSLRHGGDPISSGVRYILAVFVFVSRTPLEVFTLSTNNASDAAGMMKGNDFGKSTNAKIIYPEVSDGESTFSFGFCNF